MGPRLRGDDILRGDDRQNTEAVLVVGKAMAAPRLQPPFALDAARSAVSRGAHHLTYSGLYIPTNANMLFTLRHAAS